jgi:hypothetical protein
MEILENILVVHETKNSSTIDERIELNNKLILYIAGEILGIHPLKNVETCLNYIRCAVNNN